jgi:uncharacterized protein (TIGR02679 family)
LLDELARRFEVGDTPVSVTLRDLPESGRQALADLMGADRRPPPSSRITVQKLVAVLGLGSAEELRDAVEGLRGPLMNRRVAKIEARAARQALWSWLGEEASAVELGGQSARLAAWVDEQRAVGARGGVHTHRRRLESALAVLRRLPSEGTSLASLANDVTGDPHALDHGRTLSGMVLDAIAYAFDHPKAGDAEAARSLWEMVGVVPDPHSSTVLALGVQGDERTALGRWLAACAAVGEPAVLSLAQLRRWPVPPAPTDGCVHVVENPSIIAEASPAWDGPPLVCSSGRPTIAAVTLIRHLAAAGATVYQHADFDPTGLAITAWLAGRTGCVPWKMTAAEYLSSLSPTAPQFLGEPPETPWDPELQAIMSEHRRALYEEEIRLQLLQSMSTTSFQKKG